MGQKEGAAVPLSGGSWAPSITKWPGLRCTHVPTTKWHLDPPFGHNRHLPKIVGLCPFGGGSPSNTMWPGPRPTSTSSGVMIHPAVWPQQTWAENWGRGSASIGVSPHLTQCGRGLPPSQTGETDTDRQTGQDRQQSDSIGQTVLQTVAQKHLSAMTLMKQSPPLYSVHNTNLDIYDHENF